MKHSRLGGAGWCSVLVEDLVQKVMRLKHEHFGTY
jgi:hypothetical protein